MLLLPCSLSSSLLPSSESPLPAGVSIILTWLHHMPVRIIELWLFCREKQYMTSFFALLLRPWKITELKLSQSAQHIQAYSVKYCWTQVTWVSWVGLWMWLHPDVKLCCEWVLVLSHYGIVQSAVKTYACVLTVTQTCRPASARKFNCWTCLWMSRIILVVILILNSIWHLFALLLRLWKKI